MSTDILSAIDRAIGCQSCEGDLTGSVSDDFCSESCQVRWHSSRVGAGPASPFEHYRQRCALTVDTFHFFLDISRFAEELAAAMAVSLSTATQACVALGAALGADQEAESARARAGIAMTGAWVDETSWSAAIEDYSVVEPKAHALELRRNRNTGPAQQSRAPRAINPRRSR